MGISYYTHNLFIVLYRCRKVFGTMQALMGGDEIYHYHSKVSNLRKYALQYIYFKINLTLSLVYKEVAFSS